MRKTLLFLAVLAMMLTGCSKDDNSEPEVTESEYLQKTIIGTWVRFAQASYTDYDNFHDAISKDTLTFYNNGKYNQINEGGIKAVTNGDYSIKGHQLLLSHTWLYYLSFDNANTMRLHETGSKAYVYKYKKLN